MQIVLQGESWIHRHVQGLLRPLLWQKTLLCFLLYLDLHVALGGLVQKHAIEIHVYVGVEKASIVVNHLHLLVVN